MRLIDADKLFHEYLTNELWNIPDIVYCALLKQPTVEAIPIEWVKRWAMKSENTYNREQIVEMLNDWEKENDRTDDN